MKLGIKRTLAATAGALLLTGTLAACSSTSGGSDAAACEPKYEFTTVTEGILTLSTYDGMPYFGEADGAQQGIDADFLNQFAADSCLEAKWVVSPSASVIQAVASGRADIAAGGWYATAERGEIVGLSNPTYVELPTIFSTDGTSNVQDLAGKSVGTVAGYTWVPELQAITPDVKEYQSSDEVLQDLAAGRIQFAVLGSIDAPYLVSQNKDYSKIQSKLMDPDPAVASSVTPSLPNYPHTKGNTTLTEALNQAIADAKDNGSFAEIMTKYGLDPELVNTAEYE